MLNKTGLRTILFLLIVTCGFLFSYINAQEKADRTVATIKINDADILLSIYYSEVMFQLALTPDAAINPPTSADFERALQLVINQKLIEFLAVEPYPAKTEIKNDADYQRDLQLFRDYQIRRKLAFGLPPTKAEVDNQIRSILVFFPSTQELEKRLRIAGFNSVSDDNFRRRMESRILIERLLNFRFRSRVVITLKEEEDYYQNVFVPEFRRRNPEELIPALEKQRPQVRQILIEQKLENEIGKFLEAAGKRVKIDILSGEFK